MCGVYDRRGVRGALPRGVEWLKWIGLTIACAYCLLLG